MIARRLWGDWHIAVVLCLAVMVALVVYPLANLFLYGLFDSQTGAFTAKGLVKFFTEKPYLTATQNSIVLGLATTIGSLLIGVPAAYCVTRYRFPLRTATLLVPAVGFVIPDIIVAHAWLSMFGNNGLATQALRFVGISPPSFYGWHGLVFTMIVRHYPYVYIMMLAAFRAFDNRIAEAASGLGSMPSRVFRTAILPVVLPTILISAVVVFTLTVENFGLPAILGQRTPVLSVLIYRTFSSELGRDSLMQGVLSLVLVLIVSVLVLMQKSYLEKRVYHMHKGWPLAVVPADNLRRKLAVGCFYMVLLVSLLPVIVVVVNSFTKTVGPVLHFGHFSLGNYESVLEHAIPSIRNSYLLAGTATAVGTIFSVIVSYLVIRVRSRTSQALDILIAVPLAIAGTVIGMALVQTFNTGLIILTGTATIMVIAYFVRSIPFGVRTISAGMLHISASVEEASISLGVPPGRTVLKVVLPLLIPSIAVAATLIWITTLSELSATVILYFPRLSTMSIDIFNLINSNMIGEASAYSMILILSIFVPLAALAATRAWASSRTGAADIAQEGRGSG